MHIPPHKLLSLLLAWLIGFSPISGHALPDAACSGMDMPAQAESIGSAAETALSMGANNGICDHCLKICDCDDNCHHGTFALFGPPSSPAAEPPRRDSYDRLVSGRNPPAPLEQKEHPPRVTPG